jgi:hypothetical protein
LVSPHRSRLLTVLCRACTHFRHTESRNDADSSQERSLSRPFAFDQAGRAHRRARCANARHLLDHRRHDDASGLELSTPTVIDVQ